MEFFPPDQQQWVVQPLLDVGVELDQVRALVFRLAFEDIVREGRGTLSLVHELVADRPPEVRVAWAQAIARLSTLEFPA